jgi:hypothetical protein
MHDFKPIRVSLSEATEVEVVGTAAAGALVESALPNMGGSVMRMVGMLVAVLRFAKLDEPMPALAGAGV